MEFFNIKFQAYSVQCLSIPPSLHKCPLPFTPQTACLVDTLALHHCSDVSFAHTNAHSSGKLSTPVHFTCSLFYNLLGFVNACEISLYPTYERLFCICPSPSLFPQHYALRSIHRVSNCMTSCFLTAVFHCAYVP